MAEELLRKMAGDRFSVESAGLEPGKLNPIVVRILKEEGIDIGAKKTQSVFDLIKQGETYDYVITVCDESNSERCPMFPGMHGKIHWGFPDPSRFSGPEEEKIQKTKEVMGAIRQRLAEWIKTINFS